MKIVSLKYERKFGGSKGSAIEEYGAEGFTVDLIAEEEEHITLDGAMEKLQEAARLVFESSTKGQLLRKQQKAQEEAAKRLIEEERKKAAASLEKDDLPGKTPDAPMRRREPVQ